MDTTLEDATHPCSRIGEPCSGLIACRLLLPLRRMGPVLFARPDLTHWRSVAISQGKQE